ncbi:MULTISPECIES: Tc toxin subunit A-related protein [Niastella]|uniref:PA14 domain-containing protein n=1 Tax=Niastella soli TaxID=2821487 RepID=A0ABS3Z2C7_9BACT|nr:neuraminidase-like domain-containing protein [Niastella soli]MBO9204290.1 hypothetical protein [Niastella soli]
MKKHENRGLSDNLAKEKQELFRKEPSAVIVQMIKNAELPIPDKEVRDGVLSFFEQHPDFDIRKTSVYAAAKQQRASLAKVDPLQHAGVMDTLKTIQRISSLSDDPVVMPVMMEANLTSAHKIVAQPKSTFVNTFTKQLGGEEAAAQVYEQVANVNARNEYLFTALRDKVAGISVAAIDGKGGKQEALAVLQEMTDQSNLTLNWETLFGNADLCECDECRSVYSASAYLVELLQYMAHVGDSGYPLPELLKRRPDIGNLQLTCENANTVLPYIDIVNEIMESFIVHLPDYQAEGQAQLEVFNVTDEPTEELLAIPQHINYAAYSKLNEAVYPFALPYNQPLDAIRLLLEKMGVSRGALLNTFTKSGTPEDAVALQRAQQAEILSLSRLEYVILTKEDFYRKSYYDAKAGKVLTQQEFYTTIGVKNVWQYYGFNTETEMLTQMKQVKSRFLPTTGISFKELVAMLDAGSVNIARPKGAALAMLQRIPYSYRYLQSLVVNATDPAVKYAQVIQLLQAVFTTPEDKTAVKNWVLQYFEPIGKMIVIELGGTTPGEGAPLADLRSVAESYDISNALLQHLDGSGITTAEYEAIHRFVRLYKKLNWSIQETDLALLGLVTPDSNTRRYEITPGLLQQLIAVKKVVAQTGLPLNYLLAFWTDMQTFGEQSLYRQLFLTHNILSIDPVFAADENYNYLAKSLTIGAHLPGVLAALQLTADDLAMIRTTAGMPDVLSVHNLSVLFRYVTLARLLRLSVKRLLQLIALYGNPFVNADGTLDFIMLCEDLQLARFKPEQLNYLFTNKTEPGILPAEKTLLSLAVSLRDGLLEIGQEYKEQPGVTAEVLKSYLLLIYKEEIAARIIDFLNGKLVYTAQAVEGLPVVVPVSLADRFAYDKVKGTVSAKGILTAEQLDAIMALSKDADYYRAVKELIVQPGVFVDDNLFVLFPAGSPERNGVLGPDMDVNTQTVKIALFYKQYLPFLKAQLTKQLIIEKLSDSLQVDAAVTEWLLSDMLSAADGSRSLIKDIETVSETNTQQPGANTWTGYLIPQFDDVYTILINSSRKPEVYLDDQLLVLQPSLGNASQYESAPQRLKSGQLYSLQIKGLGINLSQFFWKTPTLPKTKVPDACFFTALKRDQFIAAWQKAHKAALFIKNFALEATELKLLQLCQDGLAGMDLNEFSLPMWRRFREYTKMRNTYNKGSISLAEFLAWTRNGINTNLADKITALTGWDLSGVTGLISAGQFNITVASFVDESPLIKLQQALAISEKSGVSTATLFSWAAPGDDFNKCLQVSESIRSSMRALYTQDEWQEVIKPVNDVLRTNQRNALISYLLVQPALKQWAENRDVPLDAETLFEFFLIDVQMESNMETSRIKQAISSVQTFIQRCFLGLESGITSDLLDRQRWEWMQHYRTWEANRKVFLYPENWIEPDLRDTKSTFFRELEAELLQEEITPEKVDMAIKGYLNKLNEMGNLDFCAMYHESYVWGYPRLTFSHIIGRTRNMPYVYYYTKFDHSQHVWTPWDKIETDIQLIEDEKESGVLTKPMNGNSLVPVVWKNRLLLFWPVFSKRTKENTVDGKPVSNMKFVEASNRTTGEVRPLEYQEIKLAWSEYKEGKWTAKQTSACVVNTMPQTKAPAVSKFFFIAETQEEQLKVHVNYEIDLTMSSAGAFTFQDGNKMTATTGDLINVNRFYPAWVAGRYMNFYASDVYWTPVSLIYENNRNGIIFNKSLAGYKLVRSVQRNFADGGMPPGFVYQEDRSDNSHNRTMLGFYDYGKSTYDVQNVYHPYTQSFLKNVKEYGVSNLFQPSTQGNTVYAVAKETYGAQNIDLWPDGGVDFGKVTNVNWFKESFGPFSVYNWELFFHVPLLIADRLSKSRQYEQARNWYQYIFDPTAPGADNDIRRYWQFLPFKTSAIDDITTILYNLQSGIGSADVGAWRSDPFNPHLIARSRPAAYMKTVVMKYLDNLIAWGDDLYRQNTLETINQSLMLYVIAGHILGPRPQVVPERGKVKAQSYNSLKDKWDVFSNALVEMELAFPYSGQVVFEGGNQHGKPYRGNNIYGFGAALYFNIPNNPQLLQYWDTVADRLFKLRHSMNIDGVVQKLSLFEPAIDPALLVQAAANGVSLNSVLNDFNVAMPYYRFQHLTARALEMCAEAKGLGSQLLSVIERRDAEALANLRSTHEVSLLKAIHTVKAAQLDESRAQLEVLSKTRENTGKRLKHFMQLLGIKDPVPAADADYTDIAGMFRDVQNASDMMLIDYEREEMTKMREAAQLQVIAGSLETMAGIAGVIPTTTGNGEPLGVGVSVSFGGQQLGAAFGASARGVQTKSNFLQFQSGSAAKKTAFLRQRQEWILQANTAGNEMVQIDKQLIAARIRISMAERELKSQEVQIEQASEMQNYLATKYTNEELYQWMEGQVRAVYRQAYQLAYDMARKAEKAYRYERGELNSNFIKLSFWNGQRDGLVAADQLSLALRQMEKAYLDNNKRDFEITKHISLVQWDPVALINLKEKGVCELQLTEEMFDLDFPGHFMRRIKSMSVSIPCVTGPYTSVSATLTLLNDKTRVSSITGSQYAEETAANDNRFVHNFSQLQSIATSHAQHDTGMFELNFRDERYLPFEGAGAISRWRLELPAEFRQFDYGTIPDVIIHMQYVAREGGGMLKQAAIDNLNDFMEDMNGDDGMVQLFNVRHEFANEWYRFQHPADGAPVLTLTGLENRLPFITRNRKVKNKQVTGIALFIRGEANTVALNGKPLAKVAVIEDIQHFSFTGDFPKLGTNWVFTPGSNASDANTWEDAWLVVRYSLQLNA